MNVTLQLHHGDRWHDAAAVTFHEPERGIEGRTRLAYDIDYFVEIGAIALSEGAPVRDARALSVRQPVTLEDAAFDGWPPFLVDLLPQGHARRTIAEALGLPPHDRSTDLALLRRAGAAPIGNIRVKEAAEEAERRLADTPPIGVSTADILERTDRFRDLADRFAFIASGTSGLQGEWPKVALTEAGDGLWYPDFQVPDSQARRHVIVKLATRSEEAMILEAEAGYAHVARDLGLTVHALPTARPGVLVVPRFDRSVEKGSLVRYGQESAVAAIGVAAFGHRESHERYLAMIRQVSSAPLDDLAEYLLRDAANLAMGNPDNHGRNTALTKTADGRIRLAPLYDFAPMRLSAEVIARSTRWSGTADHAPDWRAACRIAAGDRLPSAALMARLADRAAAFRAIPEIA
ncbi:MAG: type II toxin-antitoxin system HipA family toxin, partial [Alphaproteobacteria bacterium]|nr:type II toxin-antitoxin system HipA family toxin [Alphaproteobacteria bacterium]